MTVPLIFFLYAHRVTEESEEDQKDLEGFREDDNFYRAIKASTRYHSFIPVCVHVCYHLRGVHTTGEPWVFPSGCRSSGSPGRRSWCWAS